MSVIPVNHPMFDRRKKDDLKQRVIESLFPIREIDTEWPYRVLLDERPGPKERHDYIGDKIVYPIEWVYDRSDFGTPSLKVYCPETDEEYTLPPFLLEKLSSLEALGEQAE